MLKIKICGMRDPENLMDVSKFNPDYLGFIFFNKSPRHISNYKLVETINAIDTVIKKVGVFVNEDLVVLLNIGKLFNLDIVQLHGNETPEMCSIIKENGLGVWKVFQIDNDFDFESCEIFKNQVDMFLFDTKAPNGQGGHGFSFNWDKLNEYNLDVPFMLAGGISTENMKDLNHIKHNMLVGIDINSKFESSPGVKDINKIGTLFEFIRK
jgi:phosphoribosylanthranilate isomerase